jgi:hypothetical protein
MYFSSEPIAGGGVEHCGGQKSEADGYEENVEHIEAPYLEAEHREERI